MRKNASLQKYAQRNGGFHSGGSWLQVFPSGKWSHVSVHSQNTVHNFLQAFWKIPGKTRESEALSKYVG